MTNPNVLPQIDHSKEVIIRLDMNTSKGTISLVLFPEYAPKAVENFVTHSENGYYDGLTFHRVIKGFMIQGGDPMGTGMGGESIYGHPFEDEFSLQLFHFRGALSMANSGPNTNGSQFFIVQSDELNPQFKSQLEQAGFPQAAINQYIKEGGTPWLDHRHTVFGQVVEGFDVLDAIANVQVGPNDKPVEPVTIESITVHNG